MTSTTGSCQVDPLALSCFFTLFYCAYFVPSSRQPLDIATTPCAYALRRPHTSCVTHPTPTCQGKFEAMCGATDVSLSRYEDYSCQGGREPGFPMDFTTTCSYANSLGFSKYVPSPVPQPPLL